MYTRGPGGSVTLTTSLKPSQVHSCHQSSLLISLFNSHRIPAHRLATIRSIIPDLAQFPTTSCNAKALSAQLLLHAHTNAVSACSTRKRIYNEDVASESPVAPQQNDIRPLGPSKMGNATRYRHLQFQALAFCNLIVISVSTSSLPYERVRLSPQVAPGLAPDVITLLALKEAMDNPTHPVLTTWNITTPLCAWKGVAWSHEGSAPFNCQLESYTLTFTYATDLGAMATSMVLPSAGLTGTLSPAIAELYELKELVLGGNKLTGSIPGELGSSPSLRVVSLEHNHLTGPIPSSIWNLCRNTELTTLLLHGNNLSGSIPEPLGGAGTTCSQLVSLSLANNQLSGFIPPFIGNFANLSWLDLSYNRFTYVIPMRFANLRNLSTMIENGFSVAGNHLMGPIPPFKEGFDPRVFEGNSPWLCGPPLPTPCLGAPITSATHLRRREAMTPTAIIMLISAVAVCIVLLFYAIFHLTTLSKFKRLLKKMHLVPRTQSVNEAKFPQGKLVQFYEGGGGALTEEAVLKSASEVRSSMNYAAGTAASHC